MTVDGEPPEPPVLRLSIEPRDEGDEILYQLRLAGFSYGLSPEDRIIISHSKGDKVPLAIREAISELRPGLIEKLKGFKRSREALRKRLADDVLECRGGPLDGRFIQLQTDAGDEHRRPHPSGNYGFVLTTSTDDPELQVTASYQISDMRVPVDEAYWRYEWSHHVSRVEF